jgi:Trp operon repressor
MTAYTVPKTEIQRQVRAALDASFTQITRGGR